jgi:hypothetical protein
MLTIDEINIGDELCGIPDSITEGLDSNLIVSGIVIAKDKNSVQLDLSSLLNRELHAQYGKGLDLFWTRLKYLQFVKAINPDPSKYI